MITKKQQRQKEGGREGEGEKEREQGGRERGRERERGLTLEWRSEMRKREKLIKATELRRRVA